MEPIQVKKAKNPPKFVVHGGRRKQGSKSIDTVDAFDYWCAVPLHVVFYFNKPTCPYCLDFSPLYEFVAQKVHQSGAPMYMFMMDGPTFRPLMEKHHPGMVPSFPTVLFRHKDGRLYRWDTDIRTFQGLVGDMGRFFDDPEMQVYDHHIDKILDSQDPRWVYFYRPSLPLVPRFARRDPMIDVLEGCNSTSLLLLNTPDIAKDTCALDTEALDRPDIPVPALVDRQGNNTIAYRQLQEWLADKEKQLE